MSLMSEEIVTLYRKRQELRNRIRACTACDLHRHCTSPVPWSGPAPSEVCVIGEAPGAQEDKRGEPFVGPAGEELRRWLVPRGMDEVAFVNAVCCYPRRTPTSSERAACKGNLNDQLEFIAPTYALVVGGVAVASVLTAAVRMGEIRGLWFRINNDRTWALATWHPAAVLRNPALREQAKEDVAFFAMIAAEQMHPPLNEWCIKCGDFPVEYRYDLPLCEKHKGVKW